MSGSESVTTQDRIYHWANWVDVCSVIQLLQNAMNLASSSLLWISLLLFNVYQVKCHSNSLYSKWIVSWDFSPISHVKRISGLKQLQLNTGYHKVLQVCLSELNNLLNKTISRDFRPFVPNSNPSWPLTIDQWEFFEISRRRIMSPRGVKRSVFIKIFARVLKRIVPG